MTDEVTTKEAAAAPPGVGQQLRAAREKRGLTLDQVAAETRISNRHLQHIEAGEFEALPGRTYAVGFAKTYAKVVDLDQTDVADMVRAEMDLDPISSQPQSNFEPGDPTRAPSGRLVWFSLFAIVLLVVGMFFAARVLFAPAAELPTLAEQEEAEQAAALAAKQAEASADEDGETPSGPVTFTATGAAWVRFSDAQDRVLMEKEMAEGESYTIPANAVGPKIITARPDLLTITIGGQSVPPLAEEMQTISGMDVSAQALLARGRDTAEDSAGEEASTNTQPQARPQPAPAPAPRRTASANQATPKKAPEPATRQQPAPAPQPVETVAQPVVQELPEAEPASAGDNSGN